LHRADFLSFSNAEKQKRGLQKHFDVFSDGANQFQGGCLRDFRNKPFPTRAKIEYYQNVLTVLFHNGMTNNEDDIEVCLRLENVFLPEAGYFGLSAATGGLAGNYNQNNYNNIISSLIKQRS